MVWSIFGRSSEVVYEEREEKTKFSYKADLSDFVGLYYFDIEFCAFERPESRFASLEELKTQVDRDILFGMEYFRAQQ